MSGDADVTGTDAPRPALIPAVAFFAAETDRLRSGAKWLTGALGAVALALLAGLQLTGIGTLTGLRLAIAVTSAIVALVVFAWMIRQATELYSSRIEDVSDLLRWQSVGPDLEEAPRPPASKRARQWIARGGRPPERMPAMATLEDLDEALAIALYGHIGSSLGDLLRELDTLTGQAAKTIRGATAIDAGWHLAVERLRLAREAAQGVVVYANYQITLERFRLLTGQLLLGGMAVALSIVAFAYAVSG